MVFNPPIAHIATSATSAANAYVDRISSAITYARIYEASNTVFHNLSVKLLHPSFLSSASTVTSIATIVTSIAATVSVISRIHDFSFRSSGTTNLFLFKTAYIVCFVNFLFNVVYGCFYNLDHYIPSDYLDYVYSCNTHARKAAVNAALAAEFARDAAANATYFSDDADAWTEHAKAASDAAKRYEANAQYYVYSALNTCIEHIQRLPSDYFLKMNDKTTIDFLQAASMAYFHAASMAYFHYGTLTHNARLFHRLPENLKKDLSFIEDIFDNIAKNTDPFLINNHIECLGIFQHDYTYTDTLVQNTPFFNDLIKKIPDILPHIIKYFVNGGLLNNQVINPEQQFNFAIDLCKINSMYLKFVPPYITNRDPETAIAILEKGGPQGFDFLPSGLRNNPKVSYYGLTTLPDNHPLNTRHSWLIAVARAALSPHGQIRTLAPPSSPRVEEV